MDDKLARLTEIGFTLVGHWKTDGEGIDFELTGQANTKNVLYAFTTEDALMYVGKTVRPLKTRMSGYKKPGKTQATNIKNNDKIRDCLKAGKQVEIYVLPDNGLMHYGGFHLNLAAGLEDSLIRDLEPPWNSAGAGKPLEKELPDGTLQPIEESPSVADEESPSTGTHSSKPPTTEDFRKALLAMFATATQTGSSYIDVNAGQLHTRVGDYPSANNRMPVCCNVMKKEMHAGDVVLHAPPKGAGARVTIRYVLPREAKLSGDAVE
jgi:hypothetical protein